MHDMNELMVGMFWGGLVMALPPIVLSVWLVVLLYQRQRRDDADERDDSR
jgi:hypothetical protein